MTTNDADILRSLADGTTNEALAVIGRMLIDLARRLDALEEAVGRVELDVELASSTPFDP